MNEQAISAAYSAAIQKLFNNLAEAYIAAKGNTAEEKKADETFKRGLEFWEKVYNNALKIIKETKDSGAK